MSVNSALLGKDCEFEKDLRVFKALYPSLVLQLIGSVAVRGLQQYYRLHEKRALKTVPLPLAALVCFIFPYNFPLLIWENLLPGCHILITGVRSAGHHRKHCDVPAS